MRTLAVCDDCGIEIPVAAISGPEGTIALTVEAVPHLLHMAGYDLFCGVCLDRAGSGMECWTPGESHAELGPTGWLRSQ